MADPVEIVQKMDNLAKAWEEKSDKRAFFLRCYCMMSENMFRALDEKRFIDNQWVETLLLTFADYYFDALACFDCGESVPKVWQVAHEAAAQKKLHVLQHLFLGINAHINYDLVLTLHDLLREEWETLSDEGQKIRYHDHSMVNTIIKETIDQVQDEVIEVQTPWMDFIDKAMGRLDEKLFTGLISSWRKEVWDHSLLLIHCKSEQEKTHLINQLEEEVLKKANWIQLEVS
ncbi:MAG: hypothetical protein KDD63_00810 [Bacteroidetes bacterium]|nr:hypothetical protein [Bacteroidota bacterium]MCB0850754.1 hypothetical protein [Bacteroidota bacterium]